MAIAPLEFFNILGDKGIDFFTGIPDSLLKDFCACIEENAPKDKHIIAANEGNAIAIAAGYHLGTGKVPLVYMQNSGLGNAVNPLLSLCDPEVYSIPMIILIGFRGEPGINDEPQHIKQGKIQFDLLKAMNLSFETISKDDQNVTGKIDRGIEIASRSNKPFIILVKKDSFLPYPKKAADTDTTDVHLMTREMALELILDHLNKDTVIFSTTGKASREIFELRERKGQSHERDFLTVGSMGHCSSIALGNSKANNNKNVFCIDGDGALIMHMGALAIIGSCAGSNFKHIVINNGVHESVGGQPTVGFQIDICSIAQACGYKAVFKAETPSDVSRLVDVLQTEKGPALLEIRVNKVSRKNLGRPTTSPMENKAAFMNLQLLRQ